MIKYLSKTAPKSLSGTALLRLDFNTEDDWRMRAVLPTIQFLLKRSPKIVIVSHRGRPQPLSFSLIRANKRIGKDQGKFSLKKDATHLSRLLGRKVIFVNNFDFKKIKASIEEAPRGAIFLLENLRFLPGEEKNDPKLAKTLASLADFYVNDAFAVSHRANASVAAVTEFLPSYAGLELENEIKFLSGVMRKPKHPFVFIVGGAKASDKLGVIQYFKNKADWFLLGGGPANTILSLKGVDVKQSVKDEDADLGAIKKIAAYKNIILPVDYKWHDDKILDVGPRTIAEFSGKVAQARTILWSGPISLVEKKPYDHGSLLLAKAIAKNRGALSITGGGETVMFLKKVRLDTKFSFISTGGGAMLDYLAGKKLPGIEALR